MAAWPVHRMMMRGGGVVFNTTRCSSVWPCRGEEYTSTIMRDIRVCESWFRGMAATARSSTAGAKSATTEMERRSDDDAMQSRSRGGGGNGRRWKAGGGIEGRSQHSAKEFWDGVVPPWSSAKYIGRRELRGEEDAAAALELDEFHHVRSLGVLLSEEPRGAAGESFAVVEIGAQQFKVTPTDIIYVEKLKGIDVNEVVSLGRVMMSGSADRTVIGRPYVRGASVIAVVEEQFRDGKVYVFKKKRRKNYRRYVYACTCMCVSVKQQQEQLSSTR